MSSSTFLVMRLDENDWIPDPILLPEPNDNHANAEIVRAQCTEDAARASKLSKVSDLVGAFVKVRVVTLWTAYRYEVCDYTFKRETSPVSCTLTSTHEIDRE